MPSIKYGENEGCRTQRRDEITDHNFDRGGGRRHPYRIDIDSVLTVNGRLAGWPYAEASAPLLQRINNTLEET